MTQQLTERDAEVVRLKNSQVDQSNTVAKYAAETKRIKLEYEQKIAALELQLAERYVIYIYR